MPAFITGARGHDFGRHTPLDLLSAIGQAGFACTQLAYTKAVEGVQSYADVTPPLVEATREAAARTGVQIAVYGTYVELSFVDEARRKAEAAKVLGQIGNAKLLAAGCMGSETTPMAKQPGASRKDALESLLRSLGEIMPACEEAGVLFGIECVYHHAMNTPEATKMVLDTIASPNLRVTPSAASGTRWAAGTATRSAPSTSRARLSAPTAATTPPAWRTPPSTTPGASPCCGSCPRPACPSCGRRPCPPAPPPTSPSWSSFIKPDLYFLWEVRQGPPLFFHAFFTRIGGIGIFSLLF